MHACTSRTRDNLSMMKLLLDKGAAVEGLDGSGWPLGEAICHGGNLSVVELLLDRDAAIEGPDGFGQPLVLHCAEVS